MDYSNPMQMLTSLMTINPLQGQMPVPGMRPSQPQMVNQQIPFNEAQFRQFAITLSDENLAQFAAVARQRGISEQDITNGIRYIKSL